MSENASSPSSFLKSAATASSRIWQDAAMTLVSLRPVRRLILGAAAAIGLAAAGSGPGPLTAQVQQSPLPRGAGGTEVVFEIRTSPERAGGATEDQITILFSNTSSEQQRTPPHPLFGDDILAEFSFSGRDARAGSTLTLSRVVPDTSFLNARYLRVVNHGGDAWAGDSLSLRVGSRPLLDRQSMYPRRGAGAEAGIQKYNASQWYERVYWEVDFQRARAGRTAR